MNQIQKKQPQWKWLFRNFNEANKAVKMIRKRAIIMMGLTRVGKSCLYNSIISPQKMIGKQIEANCYYVPTQFGGRQVNLAARISHKMVSETLLPNMRNIKQNKEDKEEVTMIDMPGAGERREGSKVLLTSYGLTSVFENLSDAKFILVMTESSFLSIADNCFRNTFQEFLCLFNFSDMLPQARELLFKSVSLVITSVRPHLANKLIGQLILNLKNLKELYLQNREYMPNFDYCQMLINSLIDSNRVEPFELAQHGVQPPIISTLLTSLNSKRWRYCEISKFIKQVEYPYIRYFRLYLNPSEQKQVESYISIRFRQLQDLQIILDELIYNIKANICNKNINIREFLKQIQEKFIASDFYQDMPRNLILRNLVPRQMVNLKDRIQKILLIQNQNKQLKLIYEWRASLNTKEQNAEQIPNSAYYQTYLLEHFVKNIQLITDLCCSQQATDLFDRIKHIFNKLFYEASTLDCLKKGSELKDFNLRSILQNNINQYLFLIREEGEIKLAMEIFKNFSQYNFNLLDLGLQEIEDIIAYFLVLQKKYPQLDTIQVYKLIYKMKNIKIEKLKEIKKDKEVIIQKLKILYYATCHNISLIYFQNVSESEKLIQSLSFQRTVASEIVRSLHAMRGNLIGFAHKICNMLKLYKDQSFLFQKEIQSLQKQRGQRKLQVILAAARHQQKIGNTTKCIQFYDKFKREGGKITNGIDPVIQVRNNAQSMFQISQKCKLEEKKQLNSQSVFQCIKLCFSFLFDQNINWEFDSKKIGSTYRAKMAMMNQEGQINKQLPKNPTSIQLIEQCAQMIEICKDKRLTILIGSRRYCGLTTLAYTLQKKRLIKFEDGKYELEINSKASKINHIEASPNEFPNIFKINEEEWIIDFPNIFPYDPQIALIKGNILQKLIQQSSGFRVVLATNQEGFLQSQSAQFIRLLKFIMNIFPKNQFRIERALGFAVTMTDPQNFKMFRQAERLLLSRFKKPKQKDNQMKIIENEKKFKLSQAEQLEINQILQEVISSGRMLRFEKPNSNYEHNPANFLGQLTDNGEYISRQRYSQQKSFKIGLVIQNSFEDSQSEKILQTIRQLIIHIKSILRSLGPLIDQKLGQLLQDNRSFPPQFDRIQKILSQCSSITSKSKLFQTAGTKYEDHNQLQKIIVSFRDIIQHITRENKFEELFLPDDCISFIENAEELSKDVFKKVINFICSNDADTVPIVKAQSTTLILLNHLKWICEPLINSKNSKGKIRERISESRQISDAFSLLFDANLTQVINSLKKKVKIANITKLPYDEQKQNCLINYIQIINMISTGENATQFFQIKKTLISSLQYLFLKNGKSKQLCLMILEEIEIKIIKQNIENIEAIGDLLRNIAENIVLLHPKLGFQICKIIDCSETQQIICKKLIDFTADQKWKVQAFIELFIIMQKRGLRRNMGTVHNELLSFVGINHPDHQFLSSPIRIKARALTIQTNLVFKSDCKSIQDITHYIRKQINII